MKNIFVELTEIEVDGAGKVTTQSCWVNMSRVQEMRLDSLQIPGVGPGKDLPTTILTMNIPDYNVIVKEHPQMILRQLSKVNGEVDHD